MTIIEYKEWLIESILEFDEYNRFTKEKLKKKSIRTLERIYDNI